MSFWAEFRRRNVVKVGAAYGIVAWLLTQVVATVFPALHLPAWTSSFVIVLLLLGLPLALVLAWVFEVTPDGIKRTDDVPRAESIRHITGQKLNYIVTGLLVAAVLVMAADTYLFTGSADSSAEAAAAPSAATAAAPPPRTVLPNSVAVLPLDNLSPNEGDAYFAAGIHEEILNYLVKLKSLNVIARTSMVRYANTDKSIKEIAEELNVETVMEGSVRYANDRVRVNMQLIDPATGTHLWSEAYERDFKDIFAIQADIAMNVANALNATFTPEEQQQIEQAPNVSTETYALLLQYFDLAGTGNQSPRMLAMLDQMIARDPQFALPYGLKANTYANLLINTTFGAAGDRAETEALARANAERGLELDPTTLGSLSALALIDVFTWRLGDARQQYERALRSGRGGAYSSWFMAWTGREAEAVADAERLVALSPLEWGSHWGLGIVRSYAGDHDAAVDDFRRGIELAPPLSLQHSWLAMAEIGRGNTDEAGRELALAEQLLGNNRSIISLVDILYGYGRVGRRAEAERLFTEIQAVAANQDIGAGGWALAYLGIGDQARALEQLRLGAERARDKMLDQGFFSLMNIRMNHTEDPVLEQPEFAAVRAQLTGE
jgi:TolB-like protein/Flp pilus assembly protein TadD